MDDRRDAEKRTDDNRPVLVAIFCMPQITVDRQRKRGPEEPAQSIHEVEYAQASSQSRQARMFLCGLVEARGHNHFAENEHDHRHAQQDRVARETQEPQPRAKKDQGNHRPPFPPEARPVEARCNPDRDEMRAEHRGRQAGQVDGPDRFGRLVLVDNVLRNDRAPAAVREHDGEAT